ncbi:fructose-6-phosphate aldolase [Streptococcus chenjunshii]|uniref:Fructose-6-phosphate aldolase n=1 Tax=Streptococcus chenjunshii TaxID=2173853 RepID=A0A372KND1_9STRE|nr:fructose-6-phosphate aldolase [Streptococcus chenjunshii]AXQ77842.1 fructose-6-phosphate aldolase [Streptococcus chenjunshii]RFU51353.1 fructose-6-phosphate aldolase [Streptococcus chenjunshii]RFU53773.1 fructose-6-phosphate aldolase [Streptococcus chenjunshii]
MKLMLDTANLEAVRWGQDFLPLAGVTTNPSIIKKEGQMDFFAHLRQIRQIIGYDRTLHVQVVALEAEDMLAEARAILNHVDKEVYIKVPVTVEGLKVIKLLHAEGIYTTATAIYSKMQAYLAIAAGADYIAPYYNRMENLNIDAASAIADIAEEIKRTGAAAQILGASYKNIEQINRTVEAGGQAVTVAPDLVKQSLQLPAVTQAVQDFREDWFASFGPNQAITDL